MTSTHTGGHALPPELKSQLQNQQVQSTNNLQHMKLRDYLNRSDKSSNLDLQFVDSKNLSSKNSGSDHP